MLLLEMRKRNKVLIMTEVVIEETEAIEGDIKEIEEVKEAEENIEVATEEEVRLIILILLMKEIKYRKQLILTKKLHISLTKNYLSL